MAKFEPDFLDEPDRIEPFNGCLLVLNIGSENCDKIGMGKHFRTMLTEAVSEAHAAGWLVCYVFDNKLGSSPPPDFVDSAPEQDLVGLSNKFFNVDAIELSLLPRERMRQLAQLIERISCQPSPQGPQVLFVASFPAVATGLCKIDGDEVFLPPVKIR